MITVICRRDSKTQALIEYMQMADGPVEPTTVSHRCQIDCERAVG